MAGRKKKNRFTLFTLLIAMVILIGAYILLLNHNKGKENTDAAAAAEDTTNLVTLDTTKIKSIYFSNQNSTMTLIHDADNVWSYKEEPSFPLDQTNAGTMKDAFASIDSTMTVVEKSENLKEYGLDNPSILAVATLEDGTSTSIALGNKSPINDGYYATLNGKNTVYILASTFYDSFNKSLNQMMAIEDIPAMSTDTITHLKVENKDKGNFEIQYKEDNLIDYLGDTNWRMLQPYPTTISADKTAVSELLANYADLSFDSSVAYNVSDLSKYGLDKPSATIAVEYYEDTTAESDGTISDNSTITGDATTSEDTTVNSVSTVVETETSPTTSDSQTATSESEESKTTRTYHNYKLLIGATNEEGNYYVKPGDSNLVYTMSKDTVDKLINIDAYNITYKYTNMVSIDTIDQINIKTKDDTYTLSIERSKEKVKNDETGKEEETTVSTYFLNGNKIEESDFLNVFGSIIAIQSSRDVPDDYESKEETPAVCITINRNTKKDKNITTEYLAYDNSYYVVNGNGNKYFLTDKRQLNNIIESLEKLGK